MLYSVPNGADDDWYWMFVTVMEGFNERPGYVITNDLMRDHKLAFMEPRPFTRWRMSHVTHFEFIQVPVDETKNQTIVQFYEPGVYV